MQVNTNYIKCPIHPIELLQLICMTCTGNSLACPLCLDAQHNMHEVISLKKFMAHEVTKLFSTDGKPNQENLMKNMNTFGAAFKEFIQKLRKQIGHQINQLQKFFEEGEDRLKQELTFINGSYNIKTIYESAEAAKKLIKSGAKIPTDEQFVKRLSQIKIKIAQSVTDSCLQIRKIIYKLKGVFTDSVGFLLNSKSASSFQFCEAYCHPEIELKEKKTLALNKNFDNIYHTCVVLPALSPFNNSITLQIKKSEHKCIWVGIGDIEAIKETKYENSYKGEGAHYWIWQAGGGEQSAQLYSQNDQTHPLIGWNFDVGDQIKMEVEYKENGQKFLNFIKNKQQQRFTTPISSKIGTYYACVSLGDEGESVSIVQQH